MTTVTFDEVRFQANGDTAPGYLSKPEGDGPFPGIILIQEWWGVDDHIKDVARRFAAEGYAVLAPDLFHGEVTNEPTEAPGWDTNCRLPSFSMIAAGNTLINFSFL